MNSTTHFCGIPFICFLLLSTLETAQAAAPQYNPDKLRSLVKLPKMKFEFGFGVSSPQGFTFGGEPLDLNKLKPPAERIAELRKELNGGVRDAERYAELGLLYGKSRDDAQAQTARKRAAELFRQQVKDNPKDGWRRSELGQALLEMDQKAEGESLLRDAVVVAPEDWRCWEALGDFLTDQATDALGMTNLAAMFGQLQRTLHTPDALGAPSAGQRAKARALRDEADRCYDKAVAAAPREFGAYQARIAFRWSRRQFLDSLTEPNRTTAAPPKQSFCPPEVMTDLKEAARLTTENAYAIGLAATAEAMLNVDTESSKSADVMERGFWPFLPDSSRDYVRGAMSRLEQMGKQEDKAIAGAALAALGGMQLFIQHDPLAAEENLRRSTRLRPASDYTWGLLGILLVQSERWAELAALAEEHAKSKDSVRYRIGLAKVYEKLKRPDEVEKQVQAALKLSPNDLLANAALASLRLKRATDDASLEEVGQMMAKTKQASFERSSQEEQMAFEFVHGLYFGLAGNRQEAANHFRRLREVDPDESDYQDAYEALGL